MERRDFLKLTVAAAALGAAPLKSFGKEEGGITEREYEFGKLHRSIWEATIKMPGVSHPRSRPLTPEELVKYAGKAGVWGQYGNWLAQTAPEDYFIVHGSAFEMRWDKMRDRGYVVPNEMWYVENHFPTPVIDPDKYRLVVSGDGVSRSVEFSYNDILKMPSVTMTRAITCGENGIGHFIHRYRQEVPGMPYGFGAIGVAEWTGVPMRDVLERAGLRKEAQYVMPVGLDTPRDRMEIMGKPIPVVKALEPDTLLVYTMNGQPLPPDHGFPIRALVSSWVGPASIKWVGRLEVWQRPLAGLMSMQYGVLVGEDYPPTPPSTQGVLMTEAKMYSAFELSWPVHLPTGKQRLTGRSWSPQSTIARVDISTDGGRSWRQARLLDPNLPKAWCRWEIDWDARPGTYGIRARATDVLGNSQPDDVPYNFHGYLYNAVIDHPVVVF